MSEKTNYEPGLIMTACYALNYSEPISVELDGTVWLGPDDDRTYPPMEPILEKAKELETIQAEQKKQAEAKLLELGLTVKDLRLLGL